MTVKEYATEMGLSVNGLCEITGLSRQGLNDILVKGYTTKESQKREKAINNLLSYATDTYVEELEQANKAYKKRLELLHMLYNECTK